MVAEAASKKAKALHQMEKVDVYVK